MFALGPSERSAGVVARPLRERANCAAYALMGYWFYRWDWGEGIGFEGLDAWGEASGQTQFNEYVTAVLDEWMEATAGVPSRFGPAICLLSSRRTAAIGNGRYLDFARRVGNVLLAAPFEHGAVLLDAPSRSIFVDSLCSDPPFLVRLARLTSDERYAQRARDILLGHCAVLQNPDTGLFGHFADLGSGIAPGIPWGRGNGWAALGLVNYIVESPDEASRTEVTERFKRLCEGLKQYRVPRAGWRNLIDREESYPESSSTVLVAHAMEIALSARILDQSWREIADEAWRTVEHRIDTSGHLVNVSYRPGVNTDPSRYEHAPALRGAYPWAQGPYLLAAADRLKRA